VREEPVGARQKSIGSTTVNLREGAPASCWKMAIGYRHLHAHPAEKQDIETRCQRENEPWPKHHGTRGHEPVSDPGVRVHEPASVNCSPTGSRPRLCAVRADQTSSPTPWNAVEFDQPPRAANEDLWVQMNGGWIVRVHRSLRTRKFHPVHRTCPVRTSDLEPGRTSVIWWSGAHGWRKNI
jgi:hypothetical protein